MDLVYAVHDGNHQKVLSLVHTSDINQVDNEGYTALSWAADYGHFEIARTLLKYNADANLASRKDNTLPLTWAIKNQHPGLVKLLLQTNPNPEHITKRGNTFLTQASLCGNLEVVKLLVEAGCKINQSDRRQCSPLYLAIIKKHYKIAEYLIDHGADCLQKNKDNSIPLRVVERTRKYSLLYKMINQHPELIEKLSHKSSKHIIRIEHRYQVIIAIRYLQKHDHIIPKSPIAYLCKLSDIYTRLILSFV